MPKKFDLPENLKSATKQEWRALVEKSLNGKTIEQALSHKTYDGIEIKPLYTSEDVKSEAGAAALRNVAVEEGERPWQIISLVDIPSLNAANAQIKTDLEGGASGLYLAISDDVPFASAELPLYNSSDYQTLLNGIDLTDKSVYFSIGREALVNAANFVTYIESTSNNLGKIKGSFCLDPLSTYAAMGSYPEPEDEALINWLDAACAIKDTGTQMTAFMASGRTWQQAGASEAMELAFALASALAYVRALETTGMSIDDAFNMVDISLTTTSDLFLSTAKLRAMRLLWSKVSKECGAKPTHSKIIAEMSYLGLTKPDPEVNMLRATASTVAAGLGNADALILLPFSAAHGVANQAARRLALNTQIIAQEESHIGLVQDPTAGSWYIENLTCQLADKAWEIFTQTEKQGGMAKMLKSGKIKNMIDQIREEQVNDIATMRREITGVTTFPNLNEKTPELFEDDEENWQEISSMETMSVPTLKAPIISGPEKGTRFKDICAHIKNGAQTYILDEALEGPATLVNMLGDVENRIVEDVEFLRSLSDEQLEANNKRPSVFLANLGGASDFTARSTWAKSYFETGGIEAITNNGFANQGDLISAFENSGAVIACLCSSDTLLTEQAVDTAKALIEAGAEAIYMVARPKLLKSIKFEDRNLFQTLLYQGTDMVSTLVEAHQIIGFADEAFADGTFAV